GCRAERAAASRAFLPTAPSRIHARRPSVTRRASSVACSARVAVLNARPSAVRSIASIDGSARISVLLLADCAADLGINRESEEYADLRESGNPARKRSY